MMKKGACASIIIFETWNMSHGNFGRWKLLFLIYAELFPYTSNGESHSPLLLFFFSGGGGGGGHYVDQVL